MAPRDALLDELEVALLSEFGARTFYGRLARWTKDRELAGVLGKLELEQVESVERLRALIEELGTAAKRSSWRRAALAHGLALWARMLGLGFPLRVCTQAEETRARWYGHFQEYFLAAGDLAHASVCRDLQALKNLHANALRAWLNGF